MIYTSYFGNLKKLPNNCIPISICGKAPDWYKGLQYKKLAPKWSFFKQWKENHDNEFYKEHFQKEVLDNLDAYKVICELNMLLPSNIRYLMKTHNTNIFENSDINIVLICYEKPEEFCHRHLVSHWLRQSGFDCKEITYQDL